MARPKKVKSFLVKKVHDDETTVKFTIGADTYEKSGKSILEALQKIKPKSFMGIAKVETTVNGKSSKIPLRLVPTKMMRLFAKPIEMELFAKRLQTLL